MHQIEELGADQVTCVQAEPGCRVRLDGRERLVSLDKPGPAEVAPPGVECCSGLLGRSVVAQATGKHMVKGRIRCVVQL